MAAREQVLDDLLEVLRRGREGLLEGLLDATVGVADQALELAQRGLEVLALVLELLHVLERLLVLGLGERVDRAELLAAALQALDAGAQRVALLSGAGPGRLGREAELGRRRGELISASCAWSRARWAWTSPRVTASPRSRSRACTCDSSAAHSRSSVVELLAGRAVGGRARPRAPRPGRRGAGAPGPRRSARRWAAALVARACAARGRACASARRVPSRRARPAAARSRSRPRAAPCGRRSGPRRARPALLDQVARVRSASAASSGPARRRGLAVDLIARGVGLGDLRLRGLHRLSGLARPARPRSTSLTSASRRLRSHSTRSSPPAETCRSPPGASATTRGRPWSPRCRRSPGSRPSIDSTTHTSWEQSVREPPRGHRHPSARDVREQRLGARVAAGFARAAGRHSERARQISGDRERG